MSKKRQTGNAKRKRVCRQCNGQGNMPGHSAWPCTACKGRKVV